MGTMCVAPPVLISDLKIVRPRIISRPIRKIINAPATANDATSTPNSFRIRSPTNRKEIINTPDANVARPDSILPDFCRKSIMTGNEPTTSITENRMSVTETISLRLSMGRVSQCSVAGKPRNILLYNFSLWLGGFPATLPVRLKKLF